MASPLRSKPPATYEDLCRVPGNQVAELLGGDVYASPRPAAPHAVASSALGVEVGGAYQFGRGGPGGWWILDEPELHLAADVLVPDLAGWRRQRMPEKPEGAYFTLAPDWVCEVVSPGTARLDRVLKLPIYARESVGQAWLVDPLERTLEVFRLESGGWRLAGAYGDDALVRAEPFEAFELDLLHLWGESR